MSTATLQAALDRVTALEAELREIEDDAGEARNLGDIGEGVRAEMAATRSARRS